MGDNCSGIVNHKIVFWKSSDTNTIFWKREGEQTVYSKKLPKDKIYYLQGATKGIKQKEIIGVAFGKITAWFKTGNSE